MQLLHIQTINLGTLLFCIVFLFVFTIFNLKNMVSYVCKANLFSCRNTLDIVLRLVKIHVKQDVFSYPKLSFQLSQIVFGEFGIPREGIDI